MTRRFALPLAALVGLAGCDRAGRDMASTEEAQAVATDAAWGRGAAAPELALQKGVVGGVAEPQASPAALADSLRPRMLLRNGSARVEVAELDSAVAAVRALAARLGGYVANVSLQLGAQQVREATLTLRIPAARFEDAVGGLRPLGDLDAVDVSTEDVGEQYMDLELRLANARRLEARLLELLERRTGELEDVLAVERELARIREESERIEGRLRHLRRHVDMSTLVVTVHEPAPLLSEYPGQSLLLRSIRQAGRNFLALLGATIASLGVLLPVGLVLWGLVSFIRRRRRVRTPVTVREEPAGA